MTRDSNKPVSVTREPAETGSLWNRLSGANAQEMPMSAHPPPVPPEQRSNKGPGETGRETEAKSEAAGRKKPIDEKAGGHGAVKQNTTNTGYQQDR